MSSRCKTDYDNCGPDAEGDYCLFHKPDKSEKEAKRFYEEIKDNGEIKKIEDEEGKQKKKLVFNQEQDWRGFVFPSRPENMEKSLFFSNSVFEEMTNFKETKFEGFTNFTHGVFRSRVKFSWAEFAEKTKFRYAKFSGEVNFRNTKFGKEADFWRAKFNGKVNFLKTEFVSEAAFIDTKFGGDTTFDYAKFKNIVCFSFAEFDREAELVSARFNGVVECDSVKFNGKANFSYSEFDKNATFETTHFCDEATFFRAGFGGKASFSHTEFGGEADFSNVEFENVVDFKKGMFRENADFKLAKFNGLSDFEESTFCKNAVFSNLTFKEAVNFRKTTFKGKLNFKSTHFQKGIVLEENPSFYNTFQAQSEAFRVLKKDYEDNGEKKKADDMFVKESRALRKQRTEKDSLLSKLSAVFELVILDYSSEYGTNWIRFFYTGGVLILLFAGFYFIGSQVEKVGYIHGIGEGFWLYNLGGSLYYSVVTFATMGPLNMYPVGTYMMFLTGLQSFLGGVFLVLIGVLLGRNWTR